MIVVTGATGQLGGAIVRALVQRVPVSEVGASARDPEKAAGLSALGVRVRKGDFSEPESLAHAFEGATQVLLISSNAAAFGGDALAQHQSAIIAARAAGARRIVYTSHMAASAASAFPPARDHAATEEMLRASGLAWTSLRDGFHAASAAWMLGEALKTGTHAAPEDGKVCWTAHADLAQAAAAILADEGRFDGPTPALTGNELLDFADLTQLASSLLGRPIQRKTLTNAEFESKLGASSAPPGVAAISLGFYRASQSGEFARIDPTLEQLIGRRPTSMRELLEKQLK
jgi:uncharacterized protein YbjT (DUF2867 family)